MRGKRWHVKRETIPQWKIVRRSRSIGISDRILHVRVRGTWDVTKQLIGKLNK